MPSPGLLFSPSLQTSTCWCWNRSTLLKDLNSSRLLRLSWWPGLTWGAMLENNNNESFINLQTNPTNPPDSVWFPGPDPASTLASPLQSPSPSTHHLQGAPAPSPAPASHPSLPSASVSSCLQARSDNINQQEASEQVSIHSVTVCLKCCSMFAWIVSSSTSPTSVDSLVSCVTSNLASLQTCRAVWPGSGSGQAKEVSKDGHQILPTDLKTNSDNLLFLEMKRRLGS